ncbi:MAG TPA: SRPBCC family protein [Ktedonobacterales bacterium]|nr:SRPBCC family protein [Ktedonobacterales bacterium]
MSDLSLTQTPVAHTAMTIRRPVAEVFAAFIDPEVTTKFWFTRSSGRLEPGKQVQWDWEMYNVSSQVSVKTIEENKRILIEWSGYGTPTLVEWIFTPLPDQATFVNITNTGFSGAGDECVQQAIASTEGFTLVLAGLKAFLENGIVVPLIADRFPPDTNDARGE